MYVCGERGQTSGSSGTMESTEREIERKGEEKMRAGTRGKREIEGKNVNGKRKVQTGLQ